MNLSTINFAGKVGYNIKSEESKKYILENLERKYGLKIITKHYEKYDNSDKTKNIINTNPHMVCARSNGNPYFLYLTRYNQTSQYCIFIDKKIQPGYFYPRMILVFFQFDDVLFDDTIMDGEMVKLDGKWMFLLNDMIVYKGNYLKDQNLVKRLNLLYDMLDKMYKEDDMDICYFAVKKYFRYDQVNELLNDHVPNLKYTCRGLYFKPLFIKFKDILVNFDDSLVKKVEKKKYKKT